MAKISADDTARLYQWIDEIPLSRPKRNIGRDFSDGVLAAELAAHFFPKLVELHNYSSANGVSQKMYNWNTLNKKVFNRLGMQVSKPDLERICNCEQVAVERVLLTLQNTIENIQESGSLPAQTKAPVKHHAPLKDKQPEPPVERHSAGAGGGRRDVSRHKEPQQRGVANRQPAADPYAPPQRIRVSINQKAGLVPNPLLPNQSRQHTICPTETLTERSCSRRSRLSWSCKRQLTFWRQKFVSSSN